MPTPSIQTLVTDAQQVLNLDSISAVRSVVAVALANANTGTPLNPNLTTQQLWNEFYQVVTKPKSDIESIIANQLMKFLYAPPAPGGAGANKQVIFNDGGVLAGDPQFLWDKTTNLLTVTGSATITGDLTVDTNTLKVDSANNRVGIGTATPSASLDVNGASNLNGNVTIANTGSPFGTLFVTGSALELQANSNATNGLSLKTTSATPIIFSVNGSEAMRLNSNGLGVGVSPSYKLDASATNNLLRLTSANGNDCNIVLTQSGVGNWMLYNAATNGQLRFQFGGNERMIVDTSGNLGIGIAPSAWSLAGYKGLEIGVLGNGVFSGNGDLNISSNSYYASGSWKYAVSTVAATSYQQNAGQHIFKTAASGTAGNAITFTQAMTLDASGYLLIGTTDTAFTSGAGYKFGPGATPSSGQVGASSSNGDLTYRLYSTGAAAYRFYVGFGGTVFATNTTISAISDARLKENVQDIDVGLGAILALKPRKFDWKAGKGKDIKGDRGFIAQEFEQVFPQLVDQWADEAPEGEAPYKSVRQDLIPVLVKAIQELAAEVNALKNA